jgi:hypothetical protein
MCLSQPTVQKGGHMLQPPGEEAFTLIFDTIEKGRALSRLHLLPATKT